MLGKLQCSDAAILVLSTTDIIIHIYHRYYSYIYIYVINIINTILSYQSFWIYPIGIKTQHMHILYIIHA